MAIKKKFNIDNPTRNVYISCLETIDDDNAKRLEEKETKKEQRLAAKKVKLDARRSVLEEALAEHDLEFMSDCDECDQYLNGKKISLDAVIDAVAFTTKIKKEHDADNPNLKKH